MPAGDMGRGDAIVILGCALQPSGQPSAALERRLRVGLEAWRQAEAPEIWVCGGRRWWGVAESSAMAAWLVQHRVPAERIYAECCSLTTQENAWYCRRAAERHARHSELAHGDLDVSALGAAPPGARRIVLVTCDFHAPRALRCFIGQGFECSVRSAVTPRSAAAAEFPRRLRESLRSGFVFWLRGGGSC